MNGKDILKAGWEPGPHMVPLIARAKELRSTGLSKSEVIIQLKTEFPQEKSSKPQPLGSSKPWSEAISPTNELEQANLEKVREHMHMLMKAPVILEGAIMPDTCPAGAEKGSIPVGGAIVSEAIHPGAHSADICCSMSVSLFPGKFETKRTMDHLLKVTRFGQGGRPASNLYHHGVLQEDVWDNPYLRDLQHYAKIHMGDQGDGNHFAYLGSVEFSDDSVRALSAAGYESIAEKIQHMGPSFNALVTHHGSRGLGARVYKRGIEKAVKLMKKICPGVPKPMAWIPYDSKDGEEYWEALQYISRWTKANHRVIHETFLHRIGVKQFIEFGNEHNFVWKRGDHFYHGKGATPAWNNIDGGGLLGVIPLNMAPPILVVIGKNNQKFLSFAPHGAGRNLSRSAVTRDYKVEGWIDYERVNQSLIEQTGDLDIRWYAGQPDISETPMAYKNADTVSAQIDDFDLASITARIKPRGCIMAGAHDFGPRRRKR